MVSGASNRGLRSRSLVLLNILRSHKIDPKLLITHRFRLSHILDETFGHAAETKALKVIIEV